MIVYGTSLRIQLNYWNRSLCHILRRDDEGSPSNVNGMDEKEIDLLNKYLGYWPRTGTIRFCMPYFNQSGVTRRSPLVCDMLSVGVFTGAWMVELFVCEWAITGDILYFTVLSGNPGMVLALQRPSATWPQDSKFICEDSRYFVSVLDQALNHLSISQRPGLPWNGPTTVLGWSWVIKSINWLTGSRHLPQDEQGTAHIPVRIADALLPDDGHLEVVRYHRDGRLNCPAIRPSIHNQWQNLGVL